MSRQPIPAPGFQLVSGKRNPPKDWPKVWVQIRNGIVDEQAPWPIVGPRWKWAFDDDGKPIPHPSDVVAVKRAD